MKGGQIFALRWLLKGRDKQSGKSARFCIPRIRVSPDQILGESWKLPGEKAGIEVTSPVWFPPRLPAPKGLETSASAWL